jgi:hypothetical protein
MFILTVIIKVKKCLFLLPGTLIHLLIAYPALADATQYNQQLIDTNSEIFNLNEIELPATNAALLTQLSTSSEAIAQTETEPSTTDETTNEADIELEVIGELYLRGRRNRLKTFVCRGGNIL